MSYSITTRNAAFNAIMSRRSAIINDARAALYVHGDAVRQELDIIANIDPRVRSQRAAAFAILSPQAQFSENVRAVDILTTWLDDATMTRARLTYLLRYVGYRMVNERKASWYIGARNVIMAGALDNETFATLMRVRGFGPKTSSMALALNNEHARVFTLDTWMLNGLLGFARGGQNAVGYTATKPAYVHIMNMMLAIADELEVSPFMLQWCMWNYYRNNEHETHLPIFGL